MPEAHEPPKPGWYPYDKGTERYWDGGRWVGEVRETREATELAGAVAEQSESADSALLTEVRALPREDHATREDLEGIVKSGVSQSLKDSSSGSGSMEP